MQQYVKTIMKAFIVGCLCVLTLGCASVMNGTQQDVTIRTAADTEIFVNEKFAGQGVAKLNLARDEQHSIRVSKPGCVDKALQTQPEFNKTSLLGVIVYFGLFTIPIDFFTGAAWNISPANIEMTAECSALSDDTGA